MRSQSAEMLRKALHEAAQRDFEATGRVSSEVLWYWPKCKTPDCGHLVSLDPLFFDMWCPPCSVIMNGGTWQLNQPKPRGMVLLIDCP